MRATAGIPRRIPRPLTALAAAAVTVTGGLAGITVAASPAGAAVPAPFTDELVAAIGSPTAIAFTPDGRMLVTTQGGTVRVVQNGALVGPVALDLSSRVCANSERGLLGVAVDPAFTTNGFVFLYYSFKTAPTCDSTPVNRVSRFVMTNNTISSASETVLIDNIPSPAGNHNAGDLHFGKDGFLYVSVGDGGCDYAGGGCGGNNDAARDQNVLLGKILRIDRNGGIPAGNPFTGGGTARCNVTGRTTAGQCQETFAWGLRNPFRMAFDPNAAGTRTSVDFATGLGGGSAVHLAFGPWNNNTQALYYTTYERGGEVRRIAQTQRVTRVGVGSAEPGGIVQSSATGATPNEPYVLRMSGTAAGCPTGAPMGGQVVADPSGAIALTNRTVPTNVTSGTRYLCWVNASDAGDALSSTPINVF